MRIVIVDARERAQRLAAFRRCEQEAERVTALDLAERRHVEHLAGGQRHAVRIAPPGSQQIAMPLAEGIVHFAQHGAQRAVGALAEPEAHRIEDVSQHARKRVQIDFAARHRGCRSNAAACRSIRARFAWRRRKVAMIAIVEAQKAESVMREEPRVVRFAARQPRRPRAQRQAHRVHAIRKRVPHRPQPAMPHAARKQHVGRIEGDVVVRVHVSEFRALGCGCALRSGASRPTAPTSGRPHGSRSPSTHRRTTCCVRPAMTATHVARGSPPDRKADGCKRTRAITRVGARLANRIQRDDHRRVERQRLQAG